MKKICSILFVVAVTSFFHAQASATEVLTQPKQKPAIRSRHQELPASFFIALQFSQDGYRSFFKNVYNHPQYPQQFLALNFAHLISMAKHARQSAEPEKFLQRTLSLFGQKMERTYINPYAYTEMLIQLLTIAQFIQPKISKADVIDDIKEQISSCMVDAFRELKQNPEVTLKKLAEDIYDTLQSKQNIQHAMHYFLARGIRQLVWSSQDGIETWHNLTTLGAMLEKYYEASLIDEEMLNDLFWLLIKQYSYFLSLCGPALNQEFYDAVSATLQECPAALWTLEEPEEDITSKEDFLRSQLIEAALTSRMYSLGHIVY